MKEEKMKEEKLEEEKLKEEKIKEEKIKEEKLKQEKIKEEKMKQEKLKEEKLKEEKIKEEKLKEEKLKEAAKESKEKTKLQAVKNVTKLVNVKSNLTVKAKPVGKPAANSTSSLKINKPEVKAQTSALASSSKPLSASIQAKIAAIKATQLHSKSKWNMIKK